MSTNVSAPPHDEDETESPSKRFTWKNLDFSFLFTKHFLIILLLGQFLSFCITTTNITTSKMIYSIPTTQSFFLYVTLAIIYTPITIFKYGINGYFKMLRFRGWKYILLGLVDVEGNYFVVKGYAYTSILSMILLDAWATPVVMLLSLIFFKVRYHISQYLGIIVALAGLGIVILGDYDAGLGSTITMASDPVRGDIFAIIGATFYGISNVYEEYCVRKRPLYEVLGQMGVWGTIVSIIQISILERSEVESLVPDPLTIGMIITYNIAMIFLYTGTPVLFRLSSALFFNLSLLTSDFFTFILSYFILQTPMSKLYPVAFCCTVVGLVIYYINPAKDPDITPEYDVDNDVNNTYVNENEKDLESSLNTPR